MKEFVTGYAKYGWVRWDGTCRWWCIGQRRWISYTTICTMKRKNAWWWVKWDETPPARMHMMVVCKHKTRKIYTQKKKEWLFWYIQEWSRVWWKDLPKKKKNQRKWVASPPIRRNKVKYKMFPSVLSRCGTGSLETCTHIISRPKSSLNSFLLPKHYYYYYYFLSNLGETL